MFFVVQVVLVLTLQANLTHFNVNLKFVNFLVFFVFRNM